MDKTAYDVFRLCYAELVLIESFPNKIAAEQEIAKRLSKSPNECFYVLQRYTSLPAGE